LYGRQSQKGIVELRHQDWSLQLDTDEARQVALQILECAEAADQDGFLMSFTIEALNLTEAQGADLLTAYRKWRIAQLAKRLAKEANT